MPVIRAIPVLAVLWVVYNLLILTGDMPGLLAHNLFGVALLSGAIWNMDVSALLIALGAVALYIEIFKATRTSISSVVNHTLSTLVFIVFVIEFITVKDAGTSTFFILTLMSLVDVVAGFTVTIVAARRDFSMGDRVEL
jgi:hypothetical protein